MIERSEDLRLHGYRWSEVCLICALAMSVLLMFADDALASPITEFPIPTPSAAPLGIAAGSDGNLWFTEAQGGKIGRITPSGHVSEYAFQPAPHAVRDEVPSAITAAPDGNLWFTEPGGNKIGRITPKGRVTKFQIPTPHAWPIGITAGPDGNLWFTENEGRKIGRITPEGHITEFPIPSRGAALAYPSGITAGPDGSLWFVNTYSTHRGPTEFGIGRITPNGMITEFRTAYSEFGAGSIAAGPDGDLWFTGSGADTIGRITPTGNVTDFELPTEQAYPAGIAAGPDGNLWFTESAGLGNKIGRITPSGEVTEFRIPTAQADPIGITAGPDGDMWFTEAQANQIGRIPAAASPGTSEVIGPCKVGSVEAKIGGNGTVGILAGGDEGTIEVARFADDSFTTAINGKFKVGLGGVFGEGAGVSGVGGEGFSGSVAGGLELGLGAEFESPSNSAANSVVDALQPNSSPPKPSVALKSTTFDFGAWLSGDVGIQGGHGEGEIEAVLGAKQTYEEGRPTDSEYYLQLAASIKGLAPLSGDTAPSALSLGGELSGNWILGETVNQAQRPVSAEVELTGAESVALKSPPANLSSWLKDAALQGSGGTEADFSATLDLTNPRTRRLWSQITEGVPRIQPESVLLSELERDVAATITTYATATGSFEANGQFGEGAGISLNLNVEATEKTLKPNGAFVKLPGSPDFTTWSDCSPYKRPKRHAPRVYLSTVVNSEQLVEPSNYNLTADGDQSFEHLRWKNWGSPTATATGTLLEAELPRSQNKTFSYPGKIVATGLIECRGVEYYTHIVPSVPPGALYQPGVLLLGGCESEP
jgi:streptogramin lyase